MIKVRGQGAKVEGLLYFGTFFFPSPNEMSCLMNFDLLLVELYLYSSVIVKSTLSTCLVLWHLF